MKLIIIFLFINLLMRKINLLNLKDKNLKVEIKILNNISI